MFPFAPYSNAARKQAELYVLPERGLADFVSVVCEGTEDFD
jgi:hypothetical protein